LIFRVVRYDAGFAALSVFAAYLNLAAGHAMYHVQFVFGLAAAIFGIGFGLILQIKIANKTLRTIGKEGVWSTPSWSYFLLIGALVVVVVFLSFSNWAPAIFPSWYLALFTDFVYFMIPTALITEVLIFSRWERKNKRKIYCSIEQQKIYPYPYIINTQN
jgi:hypothetical protein